MHNHFPPRPQRLPRIYAYEDLNPTYRGLLKIGYTSVDVEQRVAQQYPTLRPDGLKAYRIVLDESASYPDGSSFTDKDVHRLLKRKGFQNVGGEWFHCAKNDVLAAVVAIRERHENVENRTQTFSMRPEQRQAVDKTMAFFHRSRLEEPRRVPRFLWNAKMRFGKTFATYQLAKSMGMRRVLVLTFKPAVEEAWDEDLLTHVDFEGWQFYSKQTHENSGIKPQELDLQRPLVCFGSFQDFLGVNNETGGIKTKNEWVHTTHWDMVVFDEYHFGAWRDTAKKLFEKEDEDDFEVLDIEEYKRDEAGNAYNETFLPITTNYYLFLSGTPFRALNSGEFIEDQIYTWTYSDEQFAKENWSDLASKNPYTALPKMVMLTYKIPESINRVALQGEFNEFDLNVFFTAEGSGSKAHFKYENEVQKWLDLIRGGYLETTIDELKLGAEKPPMPFSDTRLLNVLNHTFWFLPGVASCHAMKNLLLQKQNIFYHDYTINVAAGQAAGVGLKALEPVQKSMREPLKSKTITLSCGKLTTGVTIRPWSGILMLRNLKSPETYFQAAFRVQSPWEIDGEGNESLVLKPTCYIFDFAIERALRQIADYSSQLNLNEPDPEKKVAEFIQFLPVLAYDGSSMREVNAGEILDITLAGTSATLLAKRWESALLVNVDNDTLNRLLNNSEALNALMRIEGFRSLNNDIETIINKSEAVKKAKKDADAKPTDKEKKELSDAEKEYKSKRREIQEKLIKFATRIPIFMYLTDHRERSLKDVITQLEPGLFRKVTGLEIKDFELLLSLGVFNGSLMNDAIFKFKRYEDASLTYTGINRHEGEAVGLWDTVLSREDYERLARMQSGSMTAAPALEDDLPAPAVLADSMEKSEEEEAEPEKSDPKRVRKGRRVIGKFTRIPQSTVSTESENPAPVQAGTPGSVVKAGSRVEHSKFGKGEVIKIEDRKMVVKFEEGEKTFEYPGGITMGFLKIV